jgi:hypothetical protein
MCLLLEKGLQREMWSTIFVSEEGKGGNKTYFLILKVALEA